MGERDGNRLYYFDNIKFLLIVFVVYGHMLEIHGGGELSHSIKFFIYTFHMPAFIVISGLFFNKYDVAKSRSRALGFLGLFLAMDTVAAISSAVLYHGVSFSLFYISGMPWFLFAMAVWCVLLPILRNINPYVLIISFVVLALLVGYDDSIGPNFVLSRIIVFFPFFVLGTTINKEKMLRIASIPLVKIVAACVFVFSLAMIIKYYNDIEWIGPMLAGQNPYSKLNNYANFGVVARLLAYLLSIVIGTSFIICIPCNQTPVSKIGERSLSVYFWDIVLYKLQVVLSPDLHAWQFFICAIICTILLSEKHLFYILKKIMNMFH